MEFRLLGPLEVLQGSGPVPLGGHRQRSVLAHLALRANRTVPAVDLVDLVWGDDPPPAALNTLQSYVSRLRSALGESGRILRRDPGYRLITQPGEVDAETFEALLARARVAIDHDEAIRLLDEALGLWRGPALADLAEQPALRGEIARLEELRLRAEELRIEARLGAGAGPDLTPTLEAMVEQHPLRERFWGQLMVALYRSGRQAEALRAFDRARRVLIEELGIEPSADLQDLYDRILARAPDLLAPSRRLRGYLVKEQIGRGTFGVVHRGEDPQLGREVAIKVIRPELADRPEFVRSFEAEARLVARLEHPHIVPLYDYWREPGAAYLVMRHMAGGNLRRAMAGDDRPDGQALVTQVASALAFAHRQGVIHLDVKPENVLLDEEGNAYLSDFGIARTVAGVEEFEGVWGGSSPYLSPEQARGEPSSPASDVYSLGALATELLRTGSPPPGEGLGGVLATATAAQPADRYADAGAFLSALQAFLHQPALPTLHLRNPYKGLAAFTEADAADFFGREEMVERLLERLADPATRLLVVVGPSGSGKSSAIRAGLVPSVLRGALPGSDRWLVASMYPGTHPLAELQAALDRVAVGTGSVDDRLRAGGSMTEHLSRVLPPGSTFLLVIDQLEEAFTLSVPEERDLFLGALAVALQDDSSGFRAVASLRADFYDRPLGDRRLAELVRRGTEPLIPLTPAELEAAIVRPAAQVGVAVTPELVGVMVAEVIGQPSGLPLLQYTLSELFRTSHGADLSLEAYRAMGGLTGALVRRAEDAYHRLDPHEQESARHLFLRLVTVGENGGITRRRVPVGEIGSSSDDPTGIEDMLARFVSHRLLALDRDAASRSPTVEIAHERLLTEWGRLNGWIDTARDDLRAHRALRTAATEWTAAGRDPSYLLRGDRLARLETWAADTALVLSEREEQFLQASIAIREREHREEEQRRRREASLERRARTRLRVAVAVLAAATVVASALTAVAVTQGRRADRQAQINAARELAAASVANLEVDPELSLLLAVGAAERATIDGSPTPEAVSALHRAILADRVVMGVPGDFPAAFSPDGSTLATAVGDGGTIDLWSVPGGRPAGTFEGHTGRVIQVEFTPDGGLVSSSLDGTARRWEVATGGEACRFVGHTDEVFSMSLAPDGSRLATRGHDGTVRVWNAHTCGELRSIPVDGFGLHFHPRGDQLAVAAGSEAWVLDPATGDRLLAVGEAARDVRFAPAGDRLAVAEGEFGLAVYDLATGRELFRTTGHEGLTETVDFSPDGSLVASGGQDGLVRLWDAEVGAAGLVLSGVGSNVEHVTFDRSGTLLAAGGTSGRVLVWDVSAIGSQEIRTIRVGPEGVFLASFGPDGKAIAASGGDGLARIWDADTGAELTLLDRPDGLEFGVWWSQDGSRLVTSGPHTAGRAPADLITVWDVSGSMMATIEELPFTFTAAIDPTGTRLATAGEAGKVRLWDLAGLQMIDEREPNLGFMGEIVWHPLGTWLAAATQGDAVWLWNPGADRTETLRGHGNVVNAVAWRPDGDVLASGGEDGTVRVWDPESGQAVLEISGHPGAVRDLAWSPDGSTIVTAGFDGGVRTWDAAVGTQLGTLWNPAGIGAVSFSPDGRRLLTGADDGLVRLFTTDPAELVELAKARLTRGFSEEECRTYLHLPACPVE